MATDIEIAWLAGLLEGEGCFLIQSNSPRIQLKMTDRDVVIKAAKIMGLDSLRVKDRKGSIKPAYELTLGGSEAIRYIKLIRPYMCSRRGNKIDEIINIILTGRPNIELGKDFCGKGHSIKHPWEYYNNWQNGGRTCKRCSGVIPKFKREIGRSKNILDNNTYTPIKFANPFNKESATNG